MKIVKVLVFVLALVVASPLFAADVLDTLVQCNFTNTAVSAIVSDLARQAGVSIAFDPAVKDNLITVKIEKVTLRQALEEIMTLNQSGYIGHLGDDKFFITSNDPKGPYYNSIAKMTMVTLQNIKTDELMLLLSKYPLAGYISANPTGNAVSIYAPLDITTNILKTIATVDKEKLQVEIQAIVFDISEQKNRNYGLDVEFTEGPANPNGVKTIQLQDQVLGYLSTTAGKILAQFVNIVTADKLAILAKPKIMVLDGASAQAFIGQTIYSTSYVVGGPSTLVPGGIKAGISFTASPQVITTVNADGQMVQDIKLTVILEVSEVVGTGMQGLPVINNRTVSTTLKVRSGETINIGGLIRRLDYNVKGGIPLLKDIPLLGFLFRNSHKESRQQEIVILLTPRVVEHTPDEELNRVRNMIDTGEMNLPK